MVGRATTIRVALVGALTALIAGCAHPRGPLVVTDPDPSIKIPATAKAVRGHDLSTVPQLIKDLESDDPAVRLFASQALKRLTDVSLGYHYYDADDARTASVGRWRQWYQNQSDLAAGRSKQSTTAATQLP